MVSTTLDECDREQWDREMFSGRIFCLSLPTYSQSGELGEYTGCRKEVAESRRQR